MTLGYQWYRNDTREPVEPTRDTLVLWGYQWSQTETLLYQTGGTSVVVHYCSLLFCPYLYFGSPIMWVTYLGRRMTTCLWKSCSFGLPRVPFVNCCQFMYLVISLLLLRAGYGIWLYQFLIIAYRFTLLWNWGASGATKGYCNDVWVRVAHHEVF